MDIAIQSQIQSPLVRTLQSIPTNSANYVHGIPDNTPPFSKQQVRLASTEGSAQDISSKRVFKIPQLGRLNRMYLVYRMNGYSFSGGSSTTTQYTDNCFTFSDGIEYVELRSHTNTIQRIYGSAIPFEVASTATSDMSLKRSLQGLTGYSGTNATSSVRFEPPNMSRPAFNVSQDLVDDRGEHTVRDFLIPIPLSSTFYLKDNLQTRLMEDLELVVKTKKASNMQHQVGTQLPEAGTHGLELVVDYVNFHENVEEVIRNENFKPDIPASLLQSDYLLYKAPFIEKTTLGNGTTLTFETKLPTDALVTSMFIVPRHRTPGYEYERAFAFRDMALFFELKSSGETILSGFKYEFDGIESKQYSTVTRQYQNEGVLPLRWSDCGTHIRLGLNNNDEYFDGGISFASLVEPTLTIKATFVTSTPLPIEIETVGLGASTDVDASPELLSFDVCLKHKVLLRIDGNTGKIAKSLES